MRRHPFRGLAVEAFAVAATLFATGCGEDPATPPEDKLIDGDEALIGALASAYSALDVARFESLLANNRDANASFSFIVTGITGSPVRVWDIETEMDIHRRMFRPNEIPASDPPVDSSLWPEWISVTLTPKSDFAERPDLYVGESNPGGVDPTRWRVTSARYVADVHFELAEGDWLAVNDHDAEFVVIEDRTKKVGDETKYKLLSWSEPCGETAVLSRECWSRIKSFYAK